MTRRALQIVAVLLWIAAVSAGFFWLGQFGGAPGRAAQAPQHVQATARPRLILLAHPMCPCTRASLHELGRIAARLGKRAADVDLDVLFLHLPDAPDAWRTSPSVTLAHEIPGVHVRIDETGAETQRWGAYTSGQVLVFSPEGTLRFAGGITPGRGHEGDSAGSQAVLAALTGAPVSLATTAVFGCGLWTEPTRK